MADTYAIGRERTADGSATIVRAAGDLDINARDDLRETILAALAGGDIVVDLAAVTFLDSEALGALIDGHNAARQAGAGYRMVHARGVVHRVLTVSGATELFDL